MGGEKTLQKISVKKASKIILFNILSSFQVGGVTFNYTSCMALRMRRKQEETKAQNKYDEKQKFLAYIPLLF